MVVKKIAKRIAALGTGAVLVGSSIMGASAAADLSMYPAQYIKDGKFTGVMVVGDNAKAEDVIGVSDIATSMQAAAVKKVSSGGSSVSAEGEAWRVGTSTKQLELSENLDSGNNRESIATITSSSFIDDSELPVLLGDGEVSNSKGTAPYNQLLYFESTSTGYVQYSEDTNTDATADHLRFVNNAQLAKYELEFTSSFESDIDGTTLEDFEDSEITMMGQTYTVVTATRSAQYKTVLTLMGGSNRDTMLEGATKTYNIDGKDYEVTLTYVDTDEAQFQVNGETTQKLQDGETDKLADGTTIGVSEILYQDYAGGIHSATFFLGAQKMVLTDNNVNATSAVALEEVEIDDETIDGTTVNIEGSDDGTTFKIDSIVVNMTAQDDYYIPAGGKLSENPDLDEADLLFTRSWDVEYAGLSSEDTTQIAVTSSGDDDYNLEFVDGSGNKVKVPLANANTASTVRIGDNDDDFITKENATIDTDDWFVVTDYSDSDGERQSYVLRYEGSDRLTADNPVITFKDIGSGETIEKTLSIGTAVNNGSANPGISDLLGTGKTNVNELAQIKLGGGTFRVYNASSTAADDFNIIVDMDANGAPTNGGETVALVPTTVVLNNKAGARISVVQSGANAIKLNVSTPNADDTDDLTATPLSFVIGATTGPELTLSEDGNNHNFLSPEGDDDNDYAWTAYGAMAQLNNPTGDPAELYIDYPANQRLPQVFITGEGVSFSDASAGDGDSVVVQKIQVGATKLASEVSDIKAVSSILVGGPCANAAAATVMGNPADCAEGFEPGVGMIKMFDVGNGNVAMLVAGYSALDTRNAAQVVSNYKSYAGSLKGTAVEVKKVNNQLTVAQPAPKAAMVEEATEETA